ncbi:MAG TPA: apolipoprotein N-acyltransferase, partial [Pirellulaceae bacterium]|nr:apolipoprotein N-acyltransferase [Pirellulaceae bacterium]
MLLVVVANVLTWAAFPPLGLFPLAWFAPLAWARLIRLEQLAGRQPYWIVWGVSALAWAVLLEGVGRAYWANYFGLVLLGSYLAFYQVLTVALARVAVHRWKVSVILAAPVTWTGLELARGHLLTGFSMALLGHTQAKATSMIQIADLFGAYGVSFLVVFVGACLARSMPQSSRRWTAWPVFVAAATLACVFAYGRAKIGDLDGDEAPRTLKVALIQGTEDTIFDSATAQQRAIDSFNQYWRLTLDVCSRHDDLDLIVWPEGMFSGNLPQLTVNGIAIPPAGLDISPERFQELVAQRLKYFGEKTQGAASVVNGANDSDAAKRRTYLLVGCDTLELSSEGEKTFNAALLISPQGEVSSRYDKMHRVFLGEYVPLGDHLPWLYDFVPIGRGLTPGTQPASFDVKGINIAPSICFEITVPHLIRRQISELTQQAKRPDVLVNLTNDGWFWGTGILDLQLNCAVFRAIEMRRPTLIAANTGLTASIDSNGSIRATMPRRTEGSVVADVAIYRRPGHYERWGDWFAGLCLLCCLAVAVSSCRDR